MAGDRLTALSWGVAAALSVGAAFLTVRHATPVDAALPMIVAVISLVAWASRSWLQVAVPVLIVTEIAAGGESLRLMIFGAVIAVVFGVALAQLESSTVRSAAIAAGAVILLRWIPYEDVLVGRELLLLVICVVITVALRGTPLAVAIAVLTVFFTPAVPLRTLALPLGVLGAALVARVYGVRPIELKIPAAVAVALPLLFFAWSGVVARGPLSMLEPRQQLERTAIQVALPPGGHIVLEVPGRASSLIVSGANVAHLPAGTILGTMNPGALPIRIGEAADWGYMRRDNFYAAYNALPRRPAGTIRGYGYTAWRDGAGRVAIPPGSRTIEITADPTIPSDAALQVEGFELAP